MSKNERINIIVAPISFSVGSAGSMRLRYLINEMRMLQNVTLINLLLSKENNQIGEGFYHDNVSYETTAYNTLFGTLLSFVKVYKILRCKKGDGRNILYFYDCANNPLDNYLFLVAKWLGYKIVFDEVELYKNKLNEVSGLMYGKIVLIAINQFLVKYWADHIFCISHDILKYFDKKSSLLPISYNNEIQSAESCGSPADTVTLLYSGSFASKDDISKLIMICGNIFAQGLPIILSLCGRIPVEKENEMRNLISEYGMTENVVIHGYLEIDAYYQMIMEANICIVPRTNSTFANTGFPFKLGEYLSFGKPCIVSNTGDVSYYLSTDDVYMVEPENTGQLEQAIIQMIKNKRMRDKFSKNGKQKAELHFNPKKHVEMIMEIFHTL